SVKGALAMPPRGATGKRKRQYQHIKQSELEAGRSNDVAEEIAARTVNKQRAATGEARESTPGRRRPLATERKRATKRKSASRKRTAGASGSRSTAAKRTSGGRRSTASSRKRSSTTRATAESRSRTKRAGRKK